MSFGGTSNISTPDPRPFGLQTERVSTNESGRVLPWFAGTRWIGVTWVGDVFDVKTTKVTQKVGKKQQTVGYNYFASVAALLCNGVVDKVLRIRFDDEIVWTGPLERGEESVVDITIEGRGVFHWHWGTEDQIFHPLLVTSGQNHSAYRGQCYFVAEDLLFGQDRTTAPNIQIEVFRSNTPSWMTVPVTIGNDVNPMAVLWEWWTDTRFGAGKPESELDTSRLNATAVILYGEGIGISPLLMSDVDFKTSLLKLLECVDGYPTSYEGRLGVELVRDVTSSITTLTSNDLTDDPNIKTKQWPDTFNDIRVQFKDYAVEGEDNTATHHERANFQITGTIRAKNLDRPWVTSHDVASKMASSYGRVAALPQASGSLGLRSGSGTTLLLGSVFKLQTRDGEILQLRVIDRSEAPTDGREVTLGFETDRGWANSEFYVPTVDSHVARVTYSPSAPYDSKIQDSPYAFTLDRDKSSIIYMIARGDAYTVGYDVWRAQTESGAYEAASSRMSGNMFENFAVKAQLLTEYSAETLKIDDGVGISFQVISPDDDLLAGEWDLEDALDHKLLAMFGESANEIMSLYDLVKTSDDTYTAKTVRSLYDTIRRTHAVGTVIWLQSRTNFDVDSWSAFSSSSRFYKVQTAFGSTTYDLASVTAIAHAENARALLPLCPRNLMFDGDASSATWTDTDQGVLTWNNTSRKRSLFGLPFGEAPETDLSYVRIELRSYDGNELRDSFDVAAPAETTTLSASYLIAEINTDFSVRIYGIRNGLVSLDYDSVQVLKV